MSVDLFRQYIDPNMSENGFSESKIHIFHFEVNFLWKIIIQVYLRRFESNIINRYRSAAEISRFYALLKMYNPSICMKRASI